MVANITSVLPKDQVLTPADGQPYEDALHRWAENSERRSKFIVLPKSPQDVSKAVRAITSHTSILSDLLQVKYAVENNLEIAIKGGGHSCSGASSSEDLVIDLRHLGGVSVDPRKRLLTVGGGAIWETVDKEAAKCGLATVGGTVNHTGASSGGPLPSLNLCIYDRRWRSDARRWIRMAVGQVWSNDRQSRPGRSRDCQRRHRDVQRDRECRPVLGNPRCAYAHILLLLDTDRSRVGAGSNFGVVTSFVLKAYPQPNPVWSGLVIFAPQQLSAVIRAAQIWEKSVSQDESCMIFFACPPPAFTPALALVPFFNGPAAEGRARFKPFFDVGPVADMTQEIPYEQQNAIQNSMATHGDRKVMKSASLAQVEEDVLTNLYEEYVKLVEEYPEARAYVSLLAMTIRASDHALAGARPSLSCTPTGKSWRPPLAQRRSRIAGPSTTSPLL